MKKTLIVTGSSNSVGRTLLEKTTGYDHKIGISRSNPQIEGVKNELN